MTSRIFIGRSYIKDNGLGVCLNERQRLLGIEILSGGICNCT